MMKRYIGSVMLGSAAMLANPASALDEVFETELAPIRVTTIADGLDHPWAIEFLPDGGALVTERPGRLRYLSAGRRAFRADRRRAGGRCARIRAGCSTLRSIRILPRTASSI